VAVDLRYGADALNMGIRDDGPGPAPGGSDGNGLLGMRERATMIGGTVRTGPAQGGGFLVEAELPIESASSGVSEAESYEAAR
jgi:signal transduction histidine kinase